MPTGSTGAMASPQVMQDPASTASGSNWGGNITQGATGSNTPQSQNSSLQGALQGLQLFQQMKQNADPSAGGGMPPRSTGGVPTQPGPPGGVIGALAQIAPFFMGG